MKIRGLRWWIIVLVFLAAVLNYLDRQTLSALAPTIQADLEMDDREYADVVNLFLLAYTIAYLVSGKLVDKLGTRVGMGFFVVWWSLANTATGWVQGARSLGACRFLLGLGEAGVWPAASKAVSEWFPARQRALAIGFYTMGATMGATVAPYLVIPLAKFDYAASLPWLQEWLGNGAGWRVAFLVTGFAGLVWLLPWLLLYRKPRESAHVTAEELALIEEGGTAREGDDKAWGWGRILSFRPVWLLLLGRLLTDPVWYFYQFWFAKYLSSERGLDQGSLTITWIVYAAAGVGSLAGGWCSGLLVKKGRSAASSRLWVMLGCACMMPLSPFIAQVSGLDASMVLAVCVVFAALAWIINISALVVDVVPRHSLGTAFGVIAAGSTLGGILMNMIVAAMVSGPAVKPAGFLDQAFKSVFGPLVGALEGRGYEPWFLAMAFLHPLALLLLWAGGIQGKPATA
ncbi:MFS transporter [Luteolibacter sp. GHJ8]|uniref:MFS transporter n=1 Tax=Luteolibacter rhizosphaerae TaxID=2989719 RepID=A0ABT3FXR7_9BACT|nr:MFS transporter [Luteolibacter rhizosphaerae]MCW1912357.1 MFS transporter [Luteolibacter rhizosphaerae]